MAKDVLAPNFPQDYLKLENIYLWESKLERHTEFQAGLHSDHIRVQSRRGFEAEILDAKAQDDEKAELFRVKVTFGLRAVADQEYDEPLHSIEATFAVEYRIMRELPHDQMPKFIEFNCAHNVWPFWREHVFSTMRAASLPVFNVPFFPGKPGEKNKKGRVSKTPPHKKKESD